MFFQYVQRMLIILYDGLQSMFKNYENLAEKFQGTDIIIWICDRHISNTSNVEYTNEGSSLTFFYSLFPWKKIYLLCFCKVRSVN